MTHPLPVLPHLHIPHKTEELDDEPVTPMGQLFLRPELDNIIHFIIGVENDIDVETVKSVLNTALLTYPSRFSSLLVRQGRKHYWRKTKVNIDRHVIIINSASQTDNVDEAVNDYVANLLVPLSTDKPLWEIHVIPTLRCVVFRVHHGIGDGMSLMSLLIAMSHTLNGRPAAELLSTQKISTRSTKKSNQGSVHHIFRSSLLRLRSYADIFLKATCFPDHRTVISNLREPRLLPKIVATAKFLIADMATVKEAVGNSTINDVLLGLVSAGLSKYFEHRMEKRQRVRITAVTSVNLRQPSGIFELSKSMDANSNTRWGNMAGGIMVPMHCYKDKDNPLERLKKIKAIVDGKKESKEGYLLFMSKKQMFIPLSMKFGSFFVRMLCRKTTFHISNIMGPKEEISILGNPIKFIRFGGRGSTQLQALGLYFLSYSDRAEMQIEVVKDIIPDPEVLAKCFELSLLEMKEAAAALKTQTVTGS